MSAQQSGDLKVTIRLSEMMAPASMAMHPAEPTGFFHSTCKVEQDSGESFTAVLVRNTTGQSITVVILALGENSREDTVVTLSAGGELTHLFSHIVEKVGFVLIVNGKTVTNF